MDENELKVAETMAARAYDDQGLCMAYLKGYGAGFKNQRKLLKSLLMQIIQDLGPDQAKVIWTKAEALQ